MGWGWKFYKAVFARFITSDALLSAISQLSCASGRYLTLVTATRVEANRVGLENKLL